MNNHNSIIFPILTGLILMAVACKSQPEIEYDIIIRNGYVIDGTGTPWFYSDIGIKGDKIAAMGNLYNASSKRTIDATGYYVTPGFIDPHTHAGSGLATPELSHARPILAQGVTTLITNPCGGGPVDLEKQHQELLANGLGVNVGLLIGHGSIRKSVMGDEDREATREEVEKMKTLVRKAMDYGAFGLSTGLFYVPGIYAPQEEIIELAHIVAEYRGVHQSHIRDESNYSVGLAASVEEIINITEATGVTGIITHIKALGPPVWGASKEIVEKIYESRKKGLEIFTDQYPYEASSTGLVAALIPYWAREGGINDLRKNLEDPKLREKILVDTRENLNRRGGANRIQISSYPADRSVEGKTLQEIAIERKLDPLEVTFELIKTGSPSIVSFNMHEDDIERFMIQNWNMTCSDGSIVTMGQGVPHPRNYGTFPRRIKKYVFEENIQDLEMAIKSMTSLTSSVFGIFDRGILRPGLKADIVIFDPDRITDKATYTDPHQIAEGMVYLFVNGSLAIDNCQFTGELPGRVLQMGYHN